MKTNTTGAATRPLHAVRAVMLVGTALGSTLAGSAALAQNVTYNGPGPYTLTRTDTISGGPRTVDIRVQSGDISIDTQTVNVDNQNPNTYTQNNPTQPTGTGISAQAQGATGNVTVKSAKVVATGPGQTYGIDARTSGTGSVMIQSGSVTATTVGSTGIYALSLDGDISVTADQTIGGKRGIYTNGNHTTTITSNFATANGDTYQPNAIIGQGGTVVINSQTATLTGTNGNQGAAIYAASFTGDATINSVTASTQGLGQIGVDIQYANANGLINSGTVTTQGDYAAGIYSSAVGNNVVKSGSVTTAGVGATGIRVSPASLVSNSVPTTGSTDITSGAIMTTGANADGIVVSPVTTDTTKSNGTSVSGNTLIKSTTINATGAGARGIVVAGSTGTVGITSNAITTGGGNGIDTNAGATTIASTSITGATLRGIAAVSSATLDITSGTISVQGSTNQNTPAGGITATSAGALTITSGSIGSTGGTAYGIDARTTGTAAIGVTTTGTTAATGNGGYGVLALTDAGAISLNNSGTITTTGNTLNSVVGASNRTRYPAGLYAVSNSGAVTVNNSGTITTAGTQAEGIHVEVSRGVSLSTVPSGTLGVANVAIVNSGVITTTNLGAGIYVQAGAASGTVADAGTISVTNANTINSSVLGGIVVQSGNASTTVTNSGVINSGGQTSNASGIQVLGGPGSTTVNNSGTINLVVAPVSNLTPAAISLTGTTGAQNVTSNAIVATGAGATGIFVSANTGAITVNADAIDASGRAIRTVNTGATTINTTGNLISRVNSNTISVTAGSFDITTAAGTTVTSTGGSAAIAGGANSGDGRVTNNGTVAATGAAESGIGLTTTGNATVVSKTVTVEGTAAPSGTFASGGINVNATAGGNVSITSDSLTVNGAGRYGISAMTTGAGTITIASNAASSTSDGFATLRATSDAGAIGITGTITNYSGIGAGAIFAQSNTGAITIQSGTTTTSGVGALGVFAQTTNGNISINAGTTITTGLGVSGNATSDAVFGYSSGTGNVTVVSGTASTKGDNASAVGAVGGGIISLTSGTAASTGAQLATVYASGRGTGGVTIASTKSSATGTGAYAVEGHSTNGALTITSGIATAAQGTGIYGTAGGLVKIDSTTATAAGDGQAGIYAVGGTGVTLNSGTASSSGALQNNNGTIRRADAIYLEATTAAVNATIGSATATGAGADAIHILANGTGGAATLSITGNVSAANGYGVFIDPPGAVAVTVASGASVAGSLNGINTVGSSNTIVNAGSIGSSGGAGILASGATALTNSGAISGTGGTAVQLGATNDTVTLLTGSAVSGAIAGGGGTDAAFLSGTSNTGSATQTIAAFTGFDSVTVQKGYWTAATTGSSAFNSVAVNGGSSLELANGATGVAGISAPTITDNGTLVVRSNATSAGSTFGATKVGGSGSVLFTGAGTSTLDGTNAITTTGGIVVDSGKLVLTGTQGGAVTTNAGATFQIGNGGTGGIFTGSLVDNGTLNINHSDDYTFSGALTGNGSIVKDGAGKLTFGTGYAFTGTTTVNAGSIKLTGPVAPTTEIDLAGSGQLDLSGSSQTVAELAGTGSAASINIAGGSLNDNQATNTTFAGALVGNGSFTKSGTGSVNFTGVSTYTGPTTVNGGRLAVNGSIVSPVTVNSGGTLGGTGTTGSVTIGAGGTYAPGNSIGTQTVNGNVTFAAGSIYAVEANSAGQADRVNATGAITINGGTVAVTATPGTYNNLTNYTILTAGAGVTGTFTGVTSNLAYLSPFLTYGTGTVTLSLARNDVSFAAMASTRNQVAVANAAQALGAGNAVYNAVLVQTTTSAPVTLDQLSGEIHAALPTVLIDGGRRMADAALSRAHVQGDGVALWLQGIQSYTTGSQTGLAQLKVNKTGTFGGVDFGSGGWRIGVNGGYVDDRVDLAARASTAHVKTTYLGGTVSWNGDRATVAVGGSYAWHDLDTARSLSVAGLAPTVVSKSKANSVQVFGEVSYRLLDGPLTLAPFVRNDFTSTRSDAVVETGGLGALTIGRNRRDADFTSVGVKLAGTVHGSDTVAILPRGSVSYRHGWDDLGGDTRSVSFGGGAATFAVTGTRLGRDSLDAEGGVDVAFGQRFTIGASGFGSTSKELGDYGARISASVKF